MVNCFVLLINSDSFFALLPKTSVVFVSLVTQRDFPKTSEFICPADCRVLLNNSGFMPLVQKDLNTLAMGSITDRRRLSSVDRE